MDDEEEREQDGWEDLIKKATRAEAKARMQLSASRDMDQRCHRGNRPVHASLDKTSKDSRAKEPKSKALEPKPSSSPARFDQGGTESSEKARKDKKERWQKGKRDKKDSATIPVIGVNTTNTSAAGPKRGRKDASAVVCYNCNKKGRYSRNCTEPRKDREASKN